MSFCGWQSARPEKYRCPSFSWASIDGIIVPALADDEGILIKVKDVCITYMTEDKTGLVKDGYIIVQGTLKCLKLGRLIGFRSLAWRMTVNGTEVKQVGDRS